METRFDFRATGSSIELSGHELALRSATEDRLKAVLQVLEEKLVRRKVSLKALDYGKIEEAAKGTVRQTGDPESRDQRRPVPGHQQVHQGQRPQRRVLVQPGRPGAGDEPRSRDDLQATIAALREHDFGIPLQFENFRD